VQSKAAFFAGGNKGKNNLRQVLLCCAWQRQKQKVNSSQDNANDGKTFPNVNCACLCLDANTSLLVSFSKGESNN